MTRICVISDSHGAGFHMRRFAALAKRERFDAIVFCGDGIGDIRWLETELSRKVDCVAGNCDWRNDVVRELFLSFGGVGFLVVHGHLFGSVRYDLSELSFRAEEIGAAVALFGHTHRPTAEYCGPILMVNPGALKDGRYAVLEIEDGKVIPHLCEL